MRKGMNKTASGIFLMLLLVGTLILAFNMQSVKATPRTITVPDDYSTIQEAINNAIEGDTVYVRAGVYNERVNVNKSIQLVGEDKETTVIDGGGSGSVIRVGANNITTANFTIRNAGKTWSGTGYPPSCISGNNVNYVEIKDNILKDAAVCVWFYSSFFIGINNNIVYNGTVAGIIAYALSQITVNKNFVDSCGLMGIHLDGNCVNCNITENTIMNTLEGVEIEKSRNNLIARNQLAHNNVSIVLNQCNGLNTLKGNNMTSEWYNLIVWGAGINAFLHDIDTTNIVNGKKIYYFVNTSDLLVNSSSFLNIGYLAFVNCTRITVEDVDLSFNRDGLLLAQSTYCKLVNVTIRGNRGLLLYGGLTLFNSANNTIAHSLISNNTVGVCTYQSNGNIFHHNDFVNNTINVIPNYLSPFQQPQPSTPYSQNLWDDDYPSGGNYWSDYTGMDIKKGTNQDQPGSDGIGDVPYVISTYNKDRYPLMYPYGSSPPLTYTLVITTTVGGTTNPQPGTYAYSEKQAVPVQAIPDVGFSFKHWLFDGEEWTENPITILMDKNCTLEACFVDDIPPEIGEPVQNPPQNVEPCQSVTVTVYVTDYGTGICNVTLWYSIDNRITWAPLTMTKISVNTYQALIPGHEYCTWVTYEVIAYDNAGNNATKGKNSFYQYHVIPESLSTHLTLTTLATLAITITLMRKKGGIKQSKSFLWWKAIT